MNFLVAARKSWDIISSSRVIIPSCCASRKALSHSSIHCSTFALDGDLQSSRYLALRASLALSLAGWRWSRRFLRASWVVVAVFRILRYVGLIDHSIITLTLSMDNQAFLMIS